MRRTAALVAAALAVACAAAGGLSGCSDEGSGVASSDPPRQPSTEPSNRNHRDAPRRSHRPRQPLEQPRCPASLSNCAEASGRILYVERVDPDGDGDAHFVLASSDSITAPGISIIDVRRDLRPSPLPGPGEWLAAAGPVYRGSYGQRQIEAIAVSVAP